MCTRTLTALTTLIVLIGISHAEEQQHEDSLEESADKRSLDGYYMPQRSANWISSRPLKSLNSAANEDIGYLLQYLEKRSGEFNDEVGDRAIRSPLGTMRQVRQNAQVAHWEQCDLANALLHCKQCDLANEQAVHWEL
ncbi:(pine wood nematode) hypothetical protein [Aphelenchoides bicaudatus]|nr:(pine wood nematode) hypothetical protein [Aphelenchoides bicaudatus]